MAEAELMVLRLDWREYEDDLGIVHLDSWTFAPLERMTRDDIAKMLTDKGFERVDNYQDQDEPLNGA